MNHDIRLMTADDLPRAAAALSKAFFSDPLQCYTFPDEAERREKSPDHFAGALSYGHKFGEVYWSERGAGASVWLRPGETEMTPERIEASGIAELPEKMGEDAFGRFFAALGYAEEFHKTDAPEPHWYTMVVGVDPEFQGQGYGRALLAPVFSKADAAGVPVYLETAQPGNVTFYERLGFEVLRELVEPTSQLKMWTFKRAPKGVAIPSSGDADKL